MRWWTPPDPLAFTASDVDLALRASSDRTPSPEFFDRPVAELAGPTAALVLDRLQAIAEQVTPMPIGFVSFARVLEYPAGGGGLPWHRDRLADDRDAPPHVLEEAENRILSCTVQLSAPGDYVGGDLEAEGDDGPMLAPRDLGTVVFFASTIRHRVTPVNAGCRLSLTAFWSSP